jgi:hypothetical protein
MCAVGFARAASAAAIVDRMVSLTPSSDLTALDPRAAMEALGAGTTRPASSATTKDVPFVSSRVAAHRARIRGRSSPPPAAVKRYRSSTSICVPGRDDDCPRPSGATHMARYSSAPVTVDELATILAPRLAQQRVDGADIPLPLKTSPSGGATRDKAHVVARNVKGLRKGISHYASGRHGLTRLAELSPRHVVLCARKWLLQTPAMVFFTSIFGRIPGAIPTPAYRAALIESGHVCRRSCWPRPDWASHLQRDGLPIR